MYTWSSSDNFVFRRMVSSTTLSVGLVSAAVIGYCIYFDHKRRSHPDFKKKLREKRRKLKQGGKYNRTE